MDIIKIAKKLLHDEAESINRLATILDESFIDTIELLKSCTGKVIISGMGKSGNIGEKIAATLRSTGTPSLFLNPAESIHGDLGILTTKDIVILISKSGETFELIRIIPFIKRLGIPIISITNNNLSTIATQSDINLNISVDKEACPFNLAPTTSTTTTLALGDAICIALMQAKKFDEKDFHYLHPGGSLGKQLLHVNDVMKKEDLPIVNKEMLLKDVLKFSIEHSNRGLAIIVDDNEKLCGVFVEGDLKRLAISLNDMNEALNKPIKDYMMKFPKTINKDRFVAEAIKKMEENKITSLIVVENDTIKPIGLLHIHDILLERII